MSKRCAWQAATSLERLKGAEFDRAYMQHMVQAHREAVQLFDRGSRDATDPQVKAFASSTLPTLRGHLESAQSLAATTAKG